jgi:hypothetical protein
MQDPQLQARIKALSFLQGLNNTEKAVLCRIAHRQTQGSKSAPKKPSASP